MWDEATRTRFQQLRQRQGENCISEAEQFELASLLRELEEAESGYLAPATQRIQRERETIEAQNRTLEALTLREEALVKRLSDFLIGNPTRSTEFCIL